MTTFTNLTAMLNRALVPGCDEESMWAAFNEASRYNICAIPAEYRDSFLDRLELLESKLS